MPALPCASQPSGATAFGSCGSGCGSLWCSSRVASSSSRSSLAPSSSPRIRRGRTWSGHCQGNGCSIYPYCRFHLPSLGLHSHCALSSPCRLASLPACSLPRSSLMVLLDVLYHLLTSLATSVPMAFVLVGGMVQGATPTWFLTGWMVFRRNPGAL